MEAWHNQQNDCHSQGMAEPSKTTSEKAELDTKRLILWSCRSIAKRANTVQTHLTWLSVRVTNSCRMQRVLYIVL